MLPHVMATTRTYQTALSSQWANEEVYHALESTYLSHLSTYPMQTNDEHHAINKRIST